MSRRSKTSSAVVPVVTALIAAAVLAGATAAAGDWPGKASPGVAGQLSEDSLPGSDARLDEGIARELTAMNTGTGPECAACV